MFELHQTVSNEPDNVVYSKYLFTMRSQWYEFRTLLV